MSLQTLDTPTRLDPITIGIIGNRLISILNEQQSALVNTAFSPVVRESFDLACAVFNSTGEMIGQSIGGTPGHINSMATGLHHMVEAYPAETLVPGDVLITNDPWMTSGQINDITIATPVFNHGRLIAWFASCCHSPDIGGRILSAQANEVFEEGLRIPIMKFLAAGELNTDLANLIRVNVRTPDETIGDIYAQIAGNEVGARSLLKLLKEFDIEDIDPVAEEIISRSETALRSAIAALPDGTYSAQTIADGYGEDSLVLKVSIRIAGDNIHADFTGSSPESRHGVNVVLNYTRAYSSFAIKVAVAPEVPHNAGSFRPLDIWAPEGSILNCRPPAAVAARHLVGHFLPSLIFAALEPVLPGKLLASSADPNWLTVWRGKSRERKPFMFTMFHAGGMGARAVKDGLSATSFPGGLRSVPTEVTETLTPLIQRCRTLSTNSGGAGESRGGLGQKNIFACLSGEPWTVGINGDRILSPAKGLDGGHPGATGRFRLADGPDLAAKEQVPLSPSDEIEVTLPGGGGYGDPHARPVDQVLEDVVNGYITLEFARTAYGVDISYLGPQNALIRPHSSYRINEDATARLRTNTRR
jgi:N-methylhydantoinase B